MQSLPEIVLLAIDTTVKHTADLSRGAIDLDTLSPTNGGSNAVDTGAGVGVAGLAFSAKKAASGGAGGGAGSASSASHSRLVQRELSHAWATVVYEQAMQIHVLQKVNILIIIVVMSTMEVALHSWRLISTKPTMPTNYKRFRC